MKIKLNNTALNIALSVLLLLASGLLLQAQLRTSGAINGTVLDASGATVPGASVELVDELTGNKKTATSNESGGFRFPELPAGTYRITVTSKGFKTVVLNQITVESARTTDVTARVEIGSVSESVMVTAITPALEATSTVISNTVNQKAIVDLPLNSRSILNFALLVPGSATAGGGGSSSKFNGMPGANVNVSTDGVNNASQGYKSGGTSFFATVAPRQGAIEEVSVSTAGLGADGGAEGAMTIRFVTKRGTDRFHGGVFAQNRNDALNANSYFSNSRNIRRGKINQNDFGGNLGGPLWKNKLFFFFNSEWVRLPSASATSAAVLTPEAQQGIFRYNDANGIVRTANLLQIAGANGFASQVDPVITSQFAIMNKSMSSGVVTQQDLFRNLLSWNSKTIQTQVYPTARLDYQLNSSISITGTWNLTHQTISGTQRYPGPENKFYGDYKNTWYLGSLAMNWTISQHTVNELRYGIMHNLNSECRNISFSMNDLPNGRRGILTYPLSLRSVVPVCPAVSAFNSTTGVSDNLTLLRGDHTLTLGGSMRYIKWPNTRDIQGGPYGSTYTLGVAAGDPVSGVLTAANLPGIRSSDLPNAVSLYGVLTGRVTGITDQALVDPKTSQYSQWVVRPYDVRQLIYGFYVQDSWRAKPSLTLNYGFRWQFEGDLHDVTGIYVSPSYSDLLGPSRQLFRPGVLDGVQDPSLQRRSHTYGGDNVNPAPNVGFAWSPRYATGWRGKLFGGKTVIRGGYATSYYEESTYFFFGGPENPGVIQTLALVAGDPNFTPGLTINSPVPPLIPFPKAYNPPFRMSDFTFSSGFAANQPTMHAPYVQNWSFGVQREVAKNTVLEVRYVGNKGTHVWHSYGLNEVNTVENGFQQEFRNAQNNLTINQAAGVSSFANRGLPGQTSLPVFEAAFGARGSMPALASGSGFGSGTFLTLLTQGQAGAFANTLAGSATYVCRMFGNTFSPCTKLGYNAPGVYPINFFVANPYAAGYDIRSAGDFSYSSYHGMQVQFRRAYSSGVSVTANYTLAKSLTDIWADNGTSSVDFVTLRNRNLDKGPSPFNIRHTFLTYFTYELPFGAGRKMSTGVKAVDQVIGGWTFAGIVRLQSGTPFKLTGGGRATFNENDSGVILNGMTAGDLQNMLNNIRPGPSGTVMFADPKLIGADGRANPQLLVSPTTAGVLGGNVFLYGPKLFNADLSMTKTIAIRERVRLKVWAEALNATNTPSFAAAGTAGSVNINSLTFGQTTSQVNASGPSGGGPRNIQLRAEIVF